MKPQLTREETVSQVSRPDGQATEAQGPPLITSAVPTLDDPFDVARLRLSQDFGAQLGVKKALITVPVRKPEKQWFIRVHPEPTYRLETALLEVKEDRDTYLVDPSLWPELSDEIIPKMLFTGISRQGIVFLWPVRLPGPDGRLDEWNRSALEAAKTATEKWIRVVPNMSLGAYEVYEATNKIVEPDWPVVPFAELLRVAFKDRYIRTPDHLVIRRLRGEV